MMDVLMIGNVEKIVDFDTKYDEFVMPPESAAGLFGDSTFPGYLSLGIAIVATSLAEKGLEVRCINDYIRFLNFRDYLKLHKPRYIGVSCTLLARRHIKRLSVMLNEDIRAAGIESVLVLGGAKLKEMPTWEIVELLDDYEYIITGEGEDNFYNLITCLYSGSTECLESIGSLVYKDSDGTPVFNPPGMPVDVSKLPFPDWSLFEDFEENVPVFPIQTARGCVARCKFCFEGQLFSSNVRSRPRDHIISEIKTAVAKYGVRNFVFVDSTFTSPRKYCEELLNRIIEEDLNIHWISYARVNDVTPELAKLMVDAGCTALFLGIESGDDTILKAMRKGYKSDHITRGLKFLRDAGLFHHCNFIMGYPGETHETLARTFRLIQEEHPDTYAVYPLNITGGTALFDEIVTEDTVEHREIVSHFPEKVLEEFGFDLLEFAMTSKIDYISLISYDFMLLGQISGWSKEDIKRFYTTLNELFRHQVACWVRDGVSKRFSQRSDGILPVEWLSNKMEVFLPEQELLKKEQFILEVISSIQSLRTKHLLSQVYYGST